MAAKRPLDVTAELVAAFARSARASEYLVEVLPDDLWRASPPAGRGRTIAAIVAHMQSIRRTFARMGGASPTGPSLDRMRATRLQAVRALQQSSKGLTQLFETSLTQGRGRAGKLPRRVVDMMTYLMQHDAHHRGQITTLARDLGHEFSAADMTRLWGWRKFDDEKQRTVSA